MSGGVHTRWGWFVGMAMSGAIGSAIALCTNCVYAQITPDRTLPNNSSVTREGRTHVIEGGTRAGDNLFHSFQQFSIPTGFTAFFNNAADIQNIFSRVTGGSVSNIDGLIRANGTANLFLINPNGIIFGRNASLNIGGSFVATTANAIQFGNQGFFSASAPNTPPLLTVNPSAFLFNQIATARIQNNSEAPAGFIPAGGYAYGLRVPDGRSLLLVGGNISMDGGRLYAFGGRVELGGVAGQGMVPLNYTDNNLSLSFPDSVTRADVSFTNRAEIDVRAGGGGSIFINAQNLNMDDSQLLAGIDQGLGSNSSIAGDIDINTTGSVKLTNNSVLQNGVGPRATGKGGNIRITTGSIALTNDAELTTSTFGKGDAGNIIINADDTVSVDGNRTTISSSVNREPGSGKGGDILIGTKSLSLTNGGQLIAATLGQGDAGNVIIDARDTVFLQGVGNTGYSSLITTGTFSDAGQGGTIKVSTSSFHIADGAIVDARTSSSKTGGGVTINANTFYATNGGQVTTTTEGSGLAGNINLNVTKDVILSGSDPKYADRLARFPDIVGNVGAESGLFASTNPEATGQGGDIIINSSKLTVKDSSRIAVNSQGTGEGGNIKVQVGNLTLLNQALISAETASNQGGNVDIGLKDILLLRQGSRISTNAGIAQQLGDGGKININAPNGFIVAAPRENSDITANAFKGSGGQVQINATSIFGLTVLSREDLVRVFGFDLANIDFQQLPSSITAISQTSPNLNGQVNLNTPDVDPSRGLTQLPTNLVDASSQIDNSCNPGSKQRASSFTITGRGGLPPNPRTEPLISDAVQVDWVSLKPSTRNHNSLTVTKKPTPTREPIVQATGWTRNAKGEVVLTADASTVTPYGPGLNPASCHSSRQ